MKKMITILIAVCLIGLTITGCGDSKSKEGAVTDQGSSAATVESPPAASDETVYKCEIAFPYVKNFTYDLTCLWGEYVERESGGRIEVNVYPNSELMPLDQQYSGMFDGRIQGAVNNCANLLSMDMRWGIFDLPYVFGTGADYDPENGVFDCLEAQIALVNDSSFRTEVMEKAMLDKGLKTWFLLVDGPRYVGTVKKQLQTIDDIKGMKLRMPGGTWFEQIGHAWGYSPISMATDEMTTALMQGTIDGALVVPLYTVQSKAPINYFTMMPQSYDTFLCLEISLDWYNTLPDDLKKICDDGGAYVEQEAIDTIFEVLAETPQQIRDMGIEINYITPEEDQIGFERSIPVWQQFANEVEGGEQVLNDALRFAYGDAAPTIKKEN